MGRLRPSTSLLRVLVSLIVGLLTAAASGAARGGPATTTLTYGHWRVASVELRHAMIMQIGSTATNDPRISLTIAVKQNCTLGPVTLHWKAGDGLDAEGYGVLSVRPFAIKIANQPDEVHTGVDSRSPDTDDRYFTFGGLTPQRLSGVNGRLAIWIPGRGDGLVADGKIYFSLDGFDRASEHATKLCEHSLYFTPWAVIQ